MPVTTNMAKVMSELKQRLQKLPRHTRSNGQTVITRPSMVTVAPSVREMRCEDTKPQEFETPEMFEDKKLYETLQTEMRSLKQDTQFLGKVPMGPESKKTIICEEIAVSN